MADTQQARVRFVCQGGQGRGGAWIWIGVEDAAKNTKLAE
jgi:hypothetical protein